MSNIKNILDKYYKKLDNLDLELIISRVINKPREFILAHLDLSVSKRQKLAINKFIEKRIKGKPLAYILCEKEFYGLNFKINKDVLIPRPETELLIKGTLKEISNSITPRQDKIQNYIIIDIGTGSGNIIISIANKLKSYRTQAMSYKLYGIDISQKALEIAKFNAKKHGIERKIKFLKGNLLKPLLINNRLKLKIENLKLILVANLPYVSSQNYKKYYNQIKHEPKSALLSKENGLSHYKNLFKQINKLPLAFHCSPFTVLIEFSPEQKNKLKKLAKSYFPNAKIEFKKDLAGKWRMCKINV